MRIIRGDLQSGSVYSLLGRLFLELIIVFFGVYFAFLFSEYRMEKELMKQLHVLRQGPMGAKIRIGLEKAGETV